jgi:hypothetical protein
MSQVNPTWSPLRKVGELRQLGMEVGKSNVLFKFVILARKPCRICALERDGTFHAGADSPAGGGSIAVE